MTDLHNPFSEATTALDWLRTRKPGFPVYEPMADLVVNAAFALLEQRKPITPWHVSAVQLSLRAESDDKTPAVLATITWPGADVRQYTLHVSQPRFDVLADVLAVNDAASVRFSLLSLTDGYRIDYLRSLIKLDSLTEIANALSGDVNLTAATVQRILTSRKL